MKIVVEQHIAAPVQRIWEAMRQPAAIKQWNTPLDSWHTSDAQVDFREGGQFRYRMEANDGSA